MLRLRSVENCGEAITTGRGGFGTRCIAELSRVTTLPLAMHMTVSIVCLTLGSPLRFPELKFYGIIHPLSRILSCRDLDAAEEDAGKIDVTRATTHQLEQLIDTAALAETD